MGGPTHWLGDGDILVGVKQMPLDHVWRCADGSCFVLAPELYGLLAAPIQATAHRDISADRAVMMGHFTGGPWYVRVWRALCKILPS